jgi:hypothetical protein
MVVSGLNAWAAHMTVTYGCSAGPTDAIIVPTVVAVATYGAAMIIVSL